MEIPRGLGRAGSFPAGLIGRPPRPAWSLSVPAVGVQSGYPRG